MSKECDYCKKPIKNNPILCIDETTDNSRLEIYKASYYGYSIHAIIDNSDDSNCYPKEPSQYFPINYCPMCGRKLVEDE